MSETSLTLSEHYAASPAAVFRAWSDVDAMREWFAPSPTMKTIIKLYDFTVGGKFHINMQESNGQDHIAEGEFLEIVADRRIVMRWKWVVSSGDFPKDDTILSITMVPKGEGTDLTLTHEKLRNALDVKDHAEGWQGALQQLKKMV